MHGLMNLGNTCYINTLIQCLGHVPSVRQWLLSYTGPGEFTCEFKDIIKKMWVEEQSLMPKRFVKYIYDHFHLDRGEQHDINELLLLFLDRLSTEDVRPMSLDDIGAMNHNIQKRAVAAWKSYHKRGFHMWDHLVEGLLISQVHCKTCDKFTTHNFEPFTSLHLNLPQQTEIVDMMCGLNQLFQQESVTEWKCDHCKSIAPAEKVMRIWKLPKVLTIVWKRFTSHYQKICTPVSIPVELHFPRSFLMNREEAPYRLRSLALHHGQMNYGHYTCIGSVNDQWYHYDDLVVKKVQGVTDGRMNVQDAYLVMYEMT